MKEQIEEAAERHARQYQNSAGYYSTTQVKYIALTSCQKGIEIAQEHSKEAIEELMKALKSARAALKFAEFYEVAERIDKVLQKHHTKQ